MCVHTRSRSALLLCHRIVRRSSPFFSLHEIIMYGFAGRSDAMLMIGMLVMRALDRVRRRKGERRISQKPS
jgi:hypothetical protein